jgi:hypothetical protein
MKSITLSKNALTEVCSRFSFLADRDGFEVHSYISDAACNPFLARVAANL